jgi:hypothetical protein
MLHPSTPVRKLTSPFKTYCPQNINKTIFIVSKITNIHKQTNKQTRDCVNSCFRHAVNEICALLRYYAAWSGNSVLTFRDKLDCFTLAIWDRNVVPKRRYEITTPCCVISQKEFRQEIKVDIHTE